MRTNGQGIAMGKATILLFAALGCLGMQRQLDAQAQKPPPPLRKGGVDAQHPPEYLVGVYYFSGWWPEQPNKYHVEGRDWRTSYTERRPLLGEYNTQQTMDQEIQHAAGYGVDFFQFLWYPRPQSPDGPDQPERLNAGVAQFRGSPHRHDMRFTLEYVNHPPFSITDEDNWRDTCREWCTAMTERTYLRIEDRPVFKIHGLHHFLKECGNDPARVAARVDVLREVARETNLADPLVSAGVMAGEVPTGPAVAPFDFLTTYMDMPPLEPQDKPHPYTALIDFAEQGWRRYAERSEKPYVPYLPAGWDPKPWNDPRPSFAMPSRQEWIQALERARAALDKHPKLGIPLGGDRRVKMLLIYAWNEFGEGGIVAPTRGDHYMKLEGIREVFGQRGLVPRP